MHSQAPVPVWYHRLMMALCLSTSILSILSCSISMVAMWMVLGRKTSPQQRMALMILVTDFAKAMSISIAVCRGRYLL